MESEDKHEVNTTDDFWTQIESVLSTPCESHDNIDNVLRSYLALLEEHHEKYITNDDHFGHCAYLLYASNLWNEHAAYVRQQLVHCLLQEDETHILRISVTFLLADARENDSTFDLLNKEGAFPRLIELIAHPRQNEEFLHRTLMELLYEMSRIQKITNDDLTCVDDQFVCNLFDIIEEVSDDVNDPYHYPVIRVLLVINEQFMVAAHDPVVISKKTTPLTNKVVKVLSSQGSRYKTFGANIILLLNREDETSLQLLTLKLMYILFTTPPTYEYFYTNDLRVLVDILIRNLLDLPEDRASLRHTYLRVLYPLLEHTQLQYPPHYKREEVKKLLALLCGSKACLEGNSPLVGTAWDHFEDVDETTKRLVRRCQTVSWLVDDDTSTLVRVESPTDDRSTGPGSPTSPISPTKSGPPQLPAPRKLRKRDSSKESTLTIGGFLAPQLEGARQSSISMAEMAQQRERPGVITPSRNPNAKPGLRQTLLTKKEKPPPPKARRSGPLRPSPQAGSTELEVTRLVTSAPEQPTASHPFGDNTHESAPWQQIAQVERPDLSAATTAPNTKTSAVIQETKPQPKKPPPAPKARKGWRMRKSKDFDGEGYEPGKFSTNLPSISTKSIASPFSPPADVIPESSPFSPVQEKTLDPVERATNEDGDFTTKARKRQSVGAAMIQAQADATKQVEESLEGTHLGEPQEQAPSPTTPRQVHPPRTTSLQNRENATVLPFGLESPPVPRTILTPPGQAPIRGVPGPIIEIERSLFLDEEEQEKGNIISRTDTPDIIFEDAKETQVDDEQVSGAAHGRKHDDDEQDESNDTHAPLSRRESWEDFDNDE